MQNTELIWNCPNCTLENPESLNKCQVCDQLVIEKIWICNICSQSNAIILQFCSICGTEAVRIGSSPSNNQTSEAARIGSSPSLVWLTPHLVETSNNQISDATYQLKLQNENNKNLAVLVTDQQDRYTSDLQDEEIARILWQDEQAEQAEHDAKIHKPTMNVIFLEHNVIHFRSFLSDLEQQLVLEDCIDKLSVKHMPGVKSSDKDGPTCGFSFKTGWMADYGDEKVPCCIELAKNQHDKFIAENTDILCYLDELQQDPRLYIPKVFDSKSLWARMYGPQNGLGFHVDPPGCGWVIVISIGADIDFQYYLDTPDVLHSQGFQEPRTVRIKSGEAIMINGEVLHHGIRRVYEQTPEWWADVCKSIDQCQFTRIGLQMRVFHK
jgi:hypothetical protein